MDKVITSSEHRLALRTIILGKRRWWADPWHSIVMPHDIGYHFRGAEDKTSM